jgi:glutathione S-transferase
MKLYDYVASANCFKVRLLLAQLERPYERVPLDIFDGDTLTDEYAAINPQRSTPVLELDDGRRLVESNAILFYLGQDTAFLSDDAYERAEVVRWLIFEQLDVMSTMGGLRFRLETGRLSPDDADAVRRRAGADESLALLDAHLSQHDFLVGDRYTIADIANYAYSHVADGAGIDLAQWPAVVAWHRRVEATPRFMNDLEPYPANARVGAGRSVYM